MSMEAYQRAFGFGLRAFKKYPELIPLGAIMSVAVVGASSFACYALSYKTDVKVNRSNPEAPWESIRPDEYRKMRIVNKDNYKANPELVALRKEIGSYCP